MERDDENSTTSDGDLQSSEASTNYLEIKMEDKSDFCLRKKETSKRTRNAYKTKFIGNSFGNETAWEKVYDSWNDYYTVAAQKFEYKCEI